MQTITLTFNGTNLDLSPIPLITDNIIDWQLDLAQTNPPLLPPNLFSINIFYLENNSIKKVLKHSVTNLQNIVTDISEISNGNVKITFLLHYCNSQVVVFYDIDVVIRRPTH